MKILCWAEDEAIWLHWNQITDANITLVRVISLQEFYNVMQSHSVEDFDYFFIFLADQGFSQQVEEVVTIRSLYSQQKILVFPNQASQTAALRLFSIGINGQCSPYIGQEQLSLVLSVVDSGEIWGGKAFIQQLIMQSASNDLEERVANLARSGDGRFMELSDREQDVMSLVVKGLSNKQIGIEMAITERTVKAHLTSIFKKTNTKDRLSLALLAKNF